ncbi:5-oxoprolinase subunit PxpA [Rhodocytophaga aerolata]|uniref:5-oxoprolinase subunit A n=2 Tax=Rhodocytophaga aerolata TaxID=455078 RepID=A0ABT8R6Y8_9BACT|nr:5-oxoprolinase subunit PxpA [Rhodocytophaga aerolata]MDO1447873.1 5-oxoprolinase subunit PxpA [Rhodocytophaga aerolata]
MQPSRTIDLNADVGESFGAYQMGDDEKLLPLVSSANIACGFHAGDPSVMKKTVKLALANKVALGAHPGLPDLQGFGRRNIAISPEEAYDLVLYQVGALWAFVKAEGGVLHHIKPHGALYNMASVDPMLAQAIAEAVYKLDPELILYGLSGSELIKAGEKAGIRTASEVFADRTYQPDGTLTSRRSPHALITDPNEAIKQVVQMVNAGKVRTLSGEEISIKADTICIHGDGPHALDFARHLHEQFGQEGIYIQAFN